MDAVLKFVVDEVALEGDKGCPLDRLWTLLEERHARALRDAGDPAPPIRFDDDLRAFYWPHVASLRALSASLARPGKKAKEPAATSQLPAARIKRKAQVPRGDTRPKKKPKKAKGSDYESEAAETEESEEEAVETDESEAIETGEDSDGSGDDDSSAPRKKAKAKPAKGKAAKDPAKPAKPRGRPPKAKVKPAESEEPETPAAEEPVTATAAAAAPAAQPEPESELVEDDIIEGQAGGAYGAFAGPAVAEQAVSMHEAPITLEAAGQDPALANEAAAAAELVPVSAETLVADVQMVDADEAPKPASPTAEAADGSVKEDPAEEAEAAKPDLTVLAAMSLEDVRKLYGDRLRLVADEESRFQALTKNVDHTINIPPTTYSILASVAASRARGMTQVEIAKAFGIDPRSIFHHVKLLQSTKLVVKFPVISKGQYTNILLHNASAHLNQDYLTFLASVPADADPDVDLGGMKGMRMHTDAVKRKITDMLKEKKNGIMFVEDMHHALGFFNIDRKQRKWFNKMVDTLYKAGHVEKAEIQDDSRQTSRGVARRKCIRFISDYVPEHELESAKKKEPRDEPPVVGEGGVLADLPLDYQVYRLIGLSGEEGMISWGIRRSLHNIQPRVLTRVLEHITRPEKAPKNAQGLSRSVEFEGRERRYRYRADEAWQERMAALNVQTAERPRLNGVQIEPREARAEGTPAVEARPTTAVLERPASRANGKEREHSAPPPVSVQAGPATPVSAATDSAIEPQSPAPSAVNQRKTNISYADRKDRLVRLLEQHLILELSVGTTRLFQEFEDEELGMAYPHKMDRKTLLRMADVLETEKKLAKLTFAVPTLNGSYRTVHVMVRVDLTRESKEVQDYIAQQRDRAMVPDSARYKAVERTNLTGVEIESAQLEGPPSFTGRITLAIKPDDDEVDVDENVAPQANDAAAPEEVAKLDLPAPGDGETKERESWHDIALDYGWIPARMVRSRLVHQFLFDYVKSRATGEGGEGLADPEGNPLHYKDGGIFPTTVFFNDVSLAFYFKVIGQAVRSAAIDAYLAASPDNKMTAMRDLPMDVRQAVLVGQRVDKFRRTLKMLITILIALKIVEPVREDDKPVASKSYLDTEYRLLRSVDLRNHNLPTEDIVRSYVLDDEKSVLDYWKELYAVSTNQMLKRRGRKPKTPAEPASESAEQPASAGQDVGQAGVMSEGPAADVEMAEAGADASGPVLGTEPADATQPDSAQPVEAPTPDRTRRAGFNPEHPLYGISENKSWDEFGLLPSVRHYLNRYLDRKKGQTPLGDEELLKEIATGVALKIGRVKDYYRAVQDAFDEDNKNKPKKEPAQRGRKKKLVVATKENVPSKTGPVPPALSTATALQPVAPSASDSTTTPAKGRGGRKKKDAEKKDSEKKPAKKLGPDGRVTRKRLPWTQDEDDVLLHAYVVVGDLAGDVRFPWAAVATFFEEAKNRDLCRRRFVTLRKNPMKALLVDSWIAGWPNMRAQAIESGALAPPAKKSEFEDVLQPWVAYFRQHSHEIPMVDPEVKDLIFLPDDYSFIDVLMDAAPLHEAADPLLMVEDQQRNDYNSSRTKLLALYNSPYAVKLDGDAALPAPPDDADERELQLIRSKIKMIVMTPDENYSTQHAYNLLNKHTPAQIELASQALIDAGLIVKTRGDASARGYHLSRDFLNNLEHGFPKNLLQQASEFDSALEKEPTISFDPHSSNGTMACLLDLVASREAKLFPPNLDAALLTKVVKDSSELTVTVRITGDPASGGEVPHLAAPVKVRQGMTGTSEKDPAVGAITRMRLPPAQQTAAKSVYSKIAGAGVNGLSLESLLDATQLSERDVAKALELLKDTNVAQGNPVSLVSVAGFESMAYISHTFLKEWSVDVTPSSEGSPPRTTDTVLAPPRLWYDITGSILADKLRACRELVIASIIRWPGLSFAKLCKRLKNVLTPCEIAEVVSDSRMILSRACRGKVDVWLWNREDELFGFKNQEFKDPDGMASLFPAPAWYRALA
ncbi:hypothetical protein DFJ74DRAFT_79266 [Hyaloraphidium curvatum]|nr:hypothetical protein DFJ74DRAFT_79266 [Hyaloraphidium curvatum]